jgi:hypothetical protein
MLRISGGQFGDHCVLRIVVAALKTNAVATIVVADTASNAVRYAP